MSRTFAKPQQEAFGVRKGREPLMAMGAALVVLTLAYAGSRTRLYRASAALAAAAPALACIATGVESPDDRVWYAFMLIAVVVTSLFFSLRTAALVAVAAFSALCVLPIWVHEFRSPARLIPLLALHGILSPLLLIAARHHAAVEREGQAELRRQDSRIAELERRETLARFGARFAHDLNNLITVLDGNVDRLATSERDDAVGELRTVIGRLTVLSQQVMRSAREQTSSPRTFDVHGLMTDILPLLARIAGPGIEVNLARPHVPTRVTMEPQRLEQVLMNLVSNARDAMPSGGRIRIECRRVALDAGAAERLSLDDAADREHVMIEITDTGTGMSPATLRRIFEPFFTTKPSGRGTGLGLAIVREAVVESGGSVTVASEPGRGSRFCLFFPASQ